MEKVLDGLGWTHLFAGVVASGVVGAKKPDPRIFEATLDLIGVPRERVVHVGNDPVIDVEGPLVASSTGRATRSRGGGYHARSGWSATVREGVGTYPGQCFCSKGSFEDEVVCAAELEVYGR